MDEERISWGAFREALRQSLSGALGAWAAETRYAGPKSANDERKLVIVQTYTVAVHVDNGTITNVGVMRVSEAVLREKGRWRP